LIEGRERVITRNYSDIVDPNKKPAEEIQPQKNQTLKEEKSNSD